MMPPVIWGKPASSQSLDHGQQEQRGAGRRGSITGTTNGSHACRRMLAAGVEHGARFLVLRAQTLSDWEGERRDECLTAAIGLARRQRDAVLAGKAVELRRRYSISGLDGGELLTERGLKTVLDRERRQRKCPKGRNRWDDSFFVPSRPRRRRKKKRGPRTPAAEQGKMF